MNLKNELSTYVVIDAFAWCWSSFHDVIIIPVVNEKHAAGFDALLKVSDCLFLFTLVAKVISHVCEWVSQANHCIKSTTNQIFDIIIKRQPIGFFNNYANKSKQENIYFCSLEFLLFLLLFFAQSFIGR